MKFFSGLFGWISNNGPLTVVLYAITGVLILAAAKDGDVNTLLPTLVGLYLAQKGGSNISAHWAASRDVNSNTAEVIRAVEGIKEEIQPPKA